jgi:nucleotide-binding universal stress UspA family protein
MELHMTIAAIMVHVDFDDHAEDRIRVAAEIAGRFHSILIGVAGWPLRRKLMVQNSVVDFEPGEEGRRRILAQLDQLGETFRRCAGANPHGVEWRSFANFPGEVIAREARAADLVVLGRDLLPGDAYHTFDPGSVVLAAGRPVLILPDETRHLQTSRVLIAWKDTREARRAVRDALPFLKEAESVHIAAVSPLELEESAQAQIADVARYLVHHRVAVGGQIVSATAEAAGHVLLRFAKDQNADLIVAGAYGRARLSEWVFGGVTRDLLMTSKIPCFFSN